MPSLRHEVLTRVLPLLSSKDDVPDPEHERARLAHRNRQRREGLPTGRWLPGPVLRRRFAVDTDRSAGFASYVLTPRGRTPRSTVYYVHGGAFTAPAGTAHTAYVARLARALGARAVLPDYPLAPEHTWRDSHAALADDLARRCAAGPVVLVGDSAGGGLALALALALRDRGGPQPERLVLHAPWVDLTTSTPETYALAHHDPWLSVVRLDLYAGWWAGSPDDLGRPEVSPALGDLRGLSPALVFCGTRDLLLPGCRLLVRRAADAGWALTYVEQPDLLHVYPVLPLIPEARIAFATTLEFLR